jgi:hypothetical protein
VRVKKEWGRLAAFRIPVSVRKGEGSEDEQEGEELADLEDSRGSCHSTPGSGGYDGWRVGTRATITSQVMAAKENVMVGGGDEIRE